MEYYSNGPGDPSALDYVTKNLSNLLNYKNPNTRYMFRPSNAGIALGGKTFKLKFGHHGANQPVKQLKTGKVEITSQNHNYCVDITVSGK